MLSKSNKKITLESALELVSLKGAFMSFEMGNYFTQIDLENIKNMELLPLLCGPFTNKPSLNHYNFRLADL